MNAIIYNLSLLLLLLLWWIKMNMHIQMACIGRHIRSIFRMTALCIIMSISCLNAKQLIASVAMRQYAARNVSREEWVGY